MLYKLSLKYYNYIYDQIKVPSFLYIRNIFIIFFIDCLVIDDEPIWEPIEWSLVQTWLLFLFFFSWIAETIISSTYGSFTGRDKRVYTGLFKAFWLFELWFSINILMVCMFVMVPFYFELTYQLSYIVTWWNWYNRLFFMKFIILWLIIDIWSILLLTGLKWLNWKKIFLFVLLINFILAYLIFIQFYITFLAYFTDINWYKKTNWCDYNKLSHNPQKWGWGDADRDHFNYHKTTLNFWFKNDSLYASALFFINIFIFIYLLILEIQWLILLRKLYSTKIVSYTLLNYGLSTLNMYFTSYSCILIFILISLVYQLIRVPTEFIWIDFLNEIQSIILIDIKLILNKINL